MTISSFIMSVSDGMSASSKGRSTNRSVLMEMSGKVLVMCCSIGQGPSRRKGTACSMGAVMCMGGWVRGRPRTLRPVGVGECGAFIRKGLAGVRT
ncbi:hypothetical protein GCM10009612_39490 [Streptomyces beijiangensis]